MIMALPIPFANSLWPPEMPGKVKFSVVGELVLEDLKVAISFRSLLPLFLPHEARSDS